MGFGITSQDVQINAASLERAERDGGGYSLEWRICGGGEILSGVGAAVGKTAAVLQLQGPGRTLAERVSEVTLTRYTVPPLVGAGLGTAPKVLFMVEPPRPLRSLFGWWQPPGRQPRGKGLLLSLYDKHGHVSYQHVQAPRCCADALPLPG